MERSNDSQLWLVGAGSMAADYGKVLLALGVSLTVIGRSASSAESFTTATGLPVRTGGLDAFIEGRPPVPELAIVAVGVEALASTTMRLLKYGIKRVLVEKPGALNSIELQNLCAVADTCSATVFIGYNRRMYASVQEARKIIAADGGVLSMNFEFTEWSHVIEGLTKAPGVKERWVLGNSTHVIDLAFHLGGSPIEMTSLHSGQLSWHPTSAVFVGAGRTVRNTLFSYQANWIGPGRWGLEIVTAKKRLILRPLEQLEVMHKGSINRERLPLADKVDKNFKPGLYEQVRRFIAGDCENLCTLREQVRMWPSHLKIANYEE